MVLPSAFKRPVLALIFPSLESPLFGLAQLKTSYISSNLCLVHLLVKPKETLLLLILLLRFFFSRKITITSTALGDLPKRCTVFASNTLRSQQFHQLLWGHLYTMPTHHQEPRERAELCQAPRYCFEDRRWCLAIDSSVLSLSLATRRKSPH